MMGASRSASPTRRSSSPHDSRKKLVSRGTAFSKVPTSVSYLGDRAAAQAGSEDKRGGRRTEGEHHDRGGRGETKQVGGGGSILITF